MATIVINLDETFYKQCKQVCSNENKSVSQLILDALKDKAKDYHNNLYEMGINDTPEETTIGE